MKNEFEYNVKAYSSTILNNNIEKLKNVDNLIIELIYKDNTTSKVEIKKDFLSEHICDILSSDEVSKLNKLDISFIQDGFVNKLNSIKIF